MEEIFWQEVKPLTLKDRNKKFVEICLKLFLVFTLICYFVKIIFNVEWFIIIDRNIDVPYIIGAITYSFTFTLNMLFIIMFVNNKYNKLRLLLCGTFIFLIVFIINYFFYSSLNDYYWILSYIFPILVGFIPIHKIGIRIRISRTIMVNVISILLTFIFVTLKIKLFNFGYNDLDIITGVIYEIDLFIIFYFTLKFWHNIGGENNVCRKFLVFLQQFRRNVRKENGKESKSIKKSFKYKLFVFKFQMLQLGLVLFSSCFMLAGVRFWVYKTNFINELINNFIIFVFIYSSFAIARKKVFNNQSWHAPTFWSCTAVSVISFYLLTAGAIPLTISIYASIISGVLLAYVLSIMFEKNKKAESFEALYIIHETNQLEKETLQLEKRILELELKIERESKIDEEKKMLENLYSLALEDTDTNLRLFLESKFLTIREVEATVLHLYKESKCSWSEVRKKLAFSRSSIDDSIREIKKKLGIDTKTRF